MKMKKAEFIALSACTMMLTALGIDIMLPVFGEVRKSFHLPENSTATAQIILFFFLGQIAQIFFGILSDRYGRLAILRIGFPLYIAGGVAATYAPNMPVMFAARFVAGVGASAVFMTTIASVRDRFVGDQMAHTMSLILTIFLSTPVFAPFLGLAIAAVASWRMVFITPPMFAVVVFLWSLRLEESLPTEKRTALNRSSIVASVKKVLTNKTFLRYTFITTFLFAALSSWVASSEHIVSGLYKRPDLFAWVFAGIGLLMSFCALTNSRLSKKFGARPTLKWLLVCYTFIALLLLAYTLTYSNPPAMPVCFTAIALLLGINIAIEPNSSALAMEPMGDMAGIASAVYGTLFFFTGASLGALISNLMQTTVLPLVISFCIIGILATLLAFSDNRTKHL
ncbi:MFS transporter [Panacibacter sp. DH6]|uniref:MFS transporter n=1 Tax=Panacibacter microcysteis TaxID=2793269 RepID=A0A931E2R2_9BACT|nr:MFS transporter [Panacibacter microcysteis]MBG9377512.1 MFS transporter [Panacibacter microcysteis]